MDNALPDIFDKKYQYLVLSGGGVRGVAIIGSLQVLQDHNSLENLHTYVGSSIGSMIALMLCIGYTPEEQYKIFCNLDLNKMSDINITKFFTEFGIDDANKIVKYLQNLLEGKSINKNITFQNLKEITEKRLIVTGTCVNKRCLQYFDDKSNPEMKVIDAIRISMTWPFRFTSPIYKGNYYVDGGFLDNFPLMGILDYLAPDENVLALKLNHSFEGRGVASKISKIDDFSVNLIYTFMDENSRLRKKIMKLNQEIAKLKHSDDSKTKHKQYDIIEIDTKGYSSIQMDLSLQNKIELYNYGLYQTARFLENMFEKSISKFLE